MRSAHYVARASNGDGWLLSFSDLTLLLLFFLIFSLGSAGAKREQAAGQVIQLPKGRSTPVEALVAPVRVIPAIFAGSQAGRGTTERQARRYAKAIADRTGAASRTDQEPAPQAVLATRAETFPAAAEGNVGPENRGRAEPTETALADESLPLVTELRYRKDRPPELLITLLDMVGFTSGQADLLPPALPLLRQVRSFAVEHPEMAIEISGHTDNVPVHLPRFASNWELASARALAVAHFLLSQGGIDPCRISARGYGEHRPVAPNVSADGRARNRRVEIRFYRGDGNCPAAKATG